MRNFQFIICLLVILLVISIELAPYHGPASVPDDRSAPPVRLSIEAPPISTAVPPGSASPEDTNIPPDTGEVPDDETDIPEDTEMPPEPDDDEEEEEEEEEPVEIPPVDVLGQAHMFELPVEGATGWAAASISLLDAPQEDAEILLTLAPGQGFTIIEESDFWWNVQIGEDLSGWVEHSGCFINLPDVIPSIVYNNTNSYSSIKRSSGFEIPNITAEPLYEAWAFNHRLDREEFIVPAMYHMSKKISLIQHRALSEGNTLIIYEAFRPRETQQSVVSNLRELMEENEEVRRAINTPPWSISSFISTSISNHQRGAAIDVSLGSVSSLDTRIIGEYTYTHVIDFEEYETPSPMHELSPLSAASGIPGYPGTVFLLRYCADIGFTTIPSEWWHYNEPESIRLANEYRITGSFFTETVYSIVPP